RAGRLRRRGAHALRDLQLRDLHPVQLGVRQEQRRPAVADAARDHDGARGPRAEAPGQAPLRPRRQGRRPSGRAGAAGPLGARRLALRRGLAGRRDRAAAAHARRLDRPGAPGARPAAGRRGHVPGHGDAGCARRRADGGAGGARGGGRAAVPVDRRQAAGEARLPRLRGAAGGPGPRARHVRDTLRPRRVPDVSAPGLCPPARLPRPGDRSRWIGGRLLERLVYLGYAVPPVALALALVMFAIRFAPGAYQTFPLLVFAYLISFLALAIGPVRSGLLQVNPRMEETARSLGRGRFMAFAQVVLPSIYRNVLAGGALALMAVMKELPMTYLLAPSGYRNLAVRVFGLTNEAMMAAAAPFALAIVLFSSLFVGLLLTYEGRRDG